MLEGRPGPLRDMVVLNAAAALVVADVVDDLGAGVERAGAAIDSGDAARTLGRARRGQPGAAVDATTD